MNKPDEHILYYRLKLGQDEYAGEDLTFGGGIKANGGKGVGLPFKVLYDLAERLDAVIECEGELINDDVMKVLKVTDEHKAKAEQGTITFGPLNGANAYYLHIKIIRV